MSLAAAPSTCRSRVACTWMSRTSSGLRSRYATIGPSARHRRRRRAALAYPGDRARSRPSASSFDRTRRTAATCHRRRVLRGRSSLPGHRARRDPGPAPGISKSDAKPCSVFVPSAVGHERRRPRLSVVGRTRPAARRTRRCPRRSSAASAPPASRSTGARPTERRPS